MNRFVVAAAIATLLVATAASDSFAQGSFRQTTGYGGQSSSNPWQTGGYSYYNNNNWSGYGNYGNNYYNNSGYGNNYRNNGYRYTYNLNGYTPYPGAMPGSFNENLYGYGMPTVFNRDYLAYTGPNRVVMQRYASPNYYSPYTYLPVVK